MIRVRCRVRECEWTLATGPDLTLSQLVDEAEQHLRGHRAMSYDTRYSFLYQMFRDAGLEDNEPRAVPRGGGFG